MTPAVSVVIVNWNGLEHLETCLGSIAASDVPSSQLQVVLVDNGSTDGSVAFVRSRFPQVTVVELPGNTGFTGGTAAGVEKAFGEVLVFLNNDMRVDSRAIRLLAEAVDGTCDCAAARVLSWDGSRVDFVQGTANFEGLGFQEYYGARADAGFDHQRVTFFPNGGAFAVGRAAFERAGGFDDRFFAYYDDVDLGWRLRLTGARIRVVPAALVYHRHGATARRFPQPQKRFLMDRNALLSVLKNYGDATLERVLAPVLLLAARRIVQDTRVVKGSRTAHALAPFTEACRPRFGRRTAPTAADIYEENPGAASPEAGPVVSRMPVERLAALGDALTDERTGAYRDRLQQARCVPDDEVLPEMGRGLGHATALPSYREAHAAIVERFALRAHVGSRMRLLIITHEPLGRNFSGPGARVLEIGRALAGDVSVTIATPAEPGFADDRCTIARFEPGDARSLRLLAERSDVILVQGFTLSSYPFLRHVGIPIVADLYCPFTIEHLEMNRARVDLHGSDDDAVEAGTLSQQAAAVLRVQNEQLRDADFFLCASERQRDFWLGMLHALGRITPATYAEDPELRHLIDVVPFGVPGSPPAADPLALKGVHRGIRGGDHVIIWAGSILDWQDPATLVRAVARLTEQRDDIKLFFMGTRHPNPQVAPMATVAHTIELARTLGVLDTHVFFNDWVPYHERARYLCDADVGASTHRQHLETRLSFRTRVLDYIWCGLPIVCTDGDYFADLVKERGLGLVVVPGDVEQLASALGRVVDDRALRVQCRENLARLATEFRWERVVEPLRRFCLEPTFSAERARHLGERRNAIEDSLRFWRWARRTAVRLGISEGFLEGVRGTRLLKAAVAVTQRLSGVRSSR